MDNEKFNVGDLGYILVDLACTPENLRCYNGAECEVVLPLGDYPEDEEGTMVHGYLVLTACGKNLLVEKHELKRRPQFGDSRTVVSWADCAWKPKEMAHVNDY